MRASEASEDTEAFALYQQTITTVNAVAGSPPPVAPQVPVTVTVLDQNQRPIAGARVASSTGRHAAHERSGSGHLHPDRRLGLLLRRRHRATGYQANLGDKRSNDVALGQYVPVASSLDADSSNGAAFDFNEYDADDITVQVKDQQGIDFGGQQRCSTTSPSPPSTAPPPRAASRHGHRHTVTDANGSADIPLPTVTEGGTFTLFAGVAANPNTGNGAVPVSNVLTFKAGDATLDFTNADPASAPAGGEIVVSGTLLLEDGTALAGRPIDLSTRLDRGGNAGFNQATGADAPTLPSPPAPTAASRPSSTTGRDHRHAAHRERHHHTATADYDDPRATPTTPTRPTRST